MGSTKSKKVKIHERVEIPVYKTRGSCMTRSASIIQTPRFVWQYKTQNNFLKQRLGILPHSKNQSSDYLFLKTNKQPSLSFSKIKTLQILNNMKNTTNLKNINPENSRRNLTPPLTTPDTQMPTSETQRHRKLQLIPDPDFDKQTPNFNQRLKLTA